MGDLYFDPQGADFTEWINHFKDQVYRNWLIPESFRAGSRGRADFEFTVERSGSLSALRLLRSTGSPSLDRAGQKALTASSFAELPREYRPPRVTMTITFYYNVVPKQEMATPSKE